MEEKRELAEKGGVTFKDLFIVFKRLWRILLAVLIIVTAGMTFLGSKKQVQTYSASATLVVKANTQSYASELTETYITLLHEGVLASDVYKCNSDRSTGVWEEDFKYVAEEEKHLVIFEGLGKIYATASEGLPFITVSYNSTHSRQVAEKTLEQIIYSLQNVSKMRNSSDELIMPYGAGNVEKLGSMESMNSWVVPKNTKRFTLIGLLMGILIDIVIVFLVYKLDDTVKTKEELERLTGALFITYVEDIEDDKGGRR